LSKLNSLNINKSIGFETFDDCSIYPLNDKQSIIQSVDFFTPIVDDPYLFGQIAATNALSDIYAMGGKPLFALNIVGFPTEKLKLDILSDILNGGIDKCKEINIPILGGHSIKDDVPKYGLAVTGIINNDQIIKNNTAKYNDDIILTKPIGTGIITTAIKKNLCDKSLENKAIEIMNTLNNRAAESMMEFEINSCTDITGYGLLGHLNEMSKGSNLSAKISYNSVPVINGVSELALNKIIPGGTKKNYDFIKDHVKFDEKITEHKQFILSDAQTSGGLLITCPKSESKKLIKKINQKSSLKATIIGEFIKKKNKRIICNE